MPSARCNTLPASVVRTNEFGPFLSPFPFIVSTPLQATYPDNFRVDYALSREQQNMKGGKMYIQDKMEEYADEIFGLLDQVGPHASCWT